MSKDQTAGSKKKQSLNGASIVSPDKSLLGEEEKDDETEETDTEESERDESEKIELEGVTEDGQ